MFLAGTRAGEVRLFDARAMHAHSGGGGNKGGGGGVGVLIRTGTPVVGMLDTGGRTICAAGMNGQVGGGSALTIWDSRDADITH